MNARAIVCCLFLVAGCGSESAPATDAGTDAGSAVDAYVASDAFVASDAGPPDAGATIRVRGTVQSLFGGAISGAVVSDSLHASVASSTTDVDGVYSLFVPAGARLQLEVAKAGSLTTIAPVPPLSADLDMVTLPLATRSDADALFMPAMVTTRPGSAFVYSPLAYEDLVGAAGVVLRPSGTDVTGVYYFGPDLAASAIDPSLQASSSYGVAVGLTGALTGPATVDFSARFRGGRGCVALPGWQSAAGTDTIAAPLRPDALTVFGFDCAPPAGQRTVIGHLTEYTPGMAVGSGAAIGGVAVCLHGATACVTTDAGGDYAIDVPAADDFALTYDVAGRERILVPLRAGTTQLVRNVGLPAVGYVATTATAYGATQTAAQGAIEFFTTGPGVTVTMTSGTADGPHYFGPMVAVDPSLVATSSQGWGFFFAATPAATVDLLFHHTDPARPCTLLSDTAWTSPTPETIRVPVVAGYTTFAGLRCPVPPPPP